MLKTLTKRVLPLEITSTTPKKTTEPLKSYPSFSVAIADQTINRAIINLSSYFERMQASLQVIKVSETKLDKSFHLSA